MAKNFKKLVSIFGVLGTFVVFCTAFLTNSAVSFAEGDTVCSGRITGVTSLTDLNIGKITFDAHQGSGAEDNAAANLNIVGMLPGLAPQDREYAACLDKGVAGATYDDGTGIGPQAYEYALKGWVWSENGGFISLNCTSGVNNGGDVTGVTCGKADPVTGKFHDYGVYISPADGAGKRKLFGHAWSSTFGYIQFDGKTVGGVHYGVSLDVAGVSGGQAWSQSKNYIDFSGLIFHFPDVGVVPPGSAADWCQGKPWLCVEFDPDPELLKDVPPPELATPQELIDQVTPVISTGSGASAGSAAVSTSEFVKVADGIDGYYLNIYLREADGVMPLDSTKYNVDEFLESLEFTWKDTVKRNQLFSNSDAGPFDKEKNPWDKAGSKWDKAGSKGGAVTFKPLNFNGNFVQDKTDKGHWTSVSPIASYAPTTESKISWTSSTKPPYPVKNDEFVYAPETGKLSKNELILENITFSVDLKEKPPGGKVVLPVGVPLYPNGEVNMHLKFRPAIAIEKLYSNYLEDAILAYRSIPVNFKVAAKVFSGVFKQNIENKDYFSDLPKVDFSLSYSETETENSCNSDSIIKDFEFGFLNDFKGNPITASTLPTAFTGVKVSDLVISGEKDVQAVARLPDCDKLDASGTKCLGKTTLPCAIAKGANLYTEVKYSIGGKAISYYDNRLPRLAGDAVFNPVLVVHGNIFAQATANLRADSRVQTSGSVNMNIIRDTINENLGKYVASSKSVGGGLCTITSLGNKGGYLASVENSSACLPMSVPITIGTESGVEKVFYFKNIDVSVKLTDGTWKDNLVIIADGGNIYVDGNIYNDVIDSKSPYLSLIALRSGDNAKYIKTGNIYVGPCASGVNNIQANIVADGTIFSYNGDKTATGVDAKTGEPIWSGGYVDMVNSLSCQLLIEGTVYSSNTIGGADLDQGDKPRNYLLSGGGAVIKLPATIEQRMKAQFYDLNYLRLFKLALHTTDDGLPIDQSCGKGWTPEDQKLWSDIQAGDVGGSICGEKIGCKEIEDGSKNSCNGIDPLNKYDSTTGDGDLMSPKNETDLAKGLDHDTQLDPIYVYYRAPSKSSFVFSKAGAMNVGGK